MNICFMCEKSTDCIIYAGDVTCDGNIDVYNWFVQKMQQLEIPFCLSLAILICAVRKVPTK